MSDNVIVQFVGFEAKALVREYNFHVRQASSEIREFTKLSPASTLPYQRDRSGRVPQRPRTKGFGQHI